MHRLNVSARSHHTRVSLEGVVRYTGNANHVHDWGAVQARAPVPPEVDVLYYEIAVLHRGSKPSLNSISVGLAPGNFMLNRQPGWEPGSVAYNLRNGAVYCGGRQSIAKPGPPGSKVSIPQGSFVRVGCGLDLISDEVFFTLNGRFLPGSTVCVSDRLLVGEWVPGSGPVAESSPGVPASVARFEGAREEGALRARDEGVCREEDGLFRSRSTVPSRLGDVYPTVGLHSPGASVAFVFGPGGFAFDPSSVSRRGESTESRGRRGM